MTATSRLCDAILYAEKLNDANLWHFYAQKLCYIT